MTEAELKIMADAFLTRTLPVDRWRHEAHCLVTAYMLMRRQDIDLKAELPGLIRRYNEATGGKNTDTSGYHHTITMLYLEAIRQFITDHQYTDVAVACCDMLASAIGDKDYPLRFYSRDRLFSKEARLGWIAPDLMQGA
jgi:hypothetical protein